MRTILAALALAGLAASPALAQSTGKIGILNCDVSNGAGNGVTSTRSVTCAFDDGQGASDRYVGTLRRYGLDVGVTGPGHLSWGVLAPSGGLPRGALAGDYTGTTASATVGVGLGANMLVGGSDRTFSLQPLSMEGQTGVALAAGFGRLHLEAALEPMPARVRHSRRRHHRRHQA